MRCRIRCASSIRPSDSNFFTCAFELLAELDDRALDRRLRGDVLRRREDRDRVEPREHLAGERVEVRDRLDLVAEERDAVARSPSTPAGSRARRPSTRKRPRPSTVSLRTYWMSTSLRRTTIAVLLLAHVQEDDPLLVLLGRAEAVDARDRGDDHDVAAREQVRRRRVAEPVDVVVPRAVLLDVEVGLRDVRLGLVVVVVGDEVLDRVRAGRTRGTRCRAARRASCCGRSRAPAGRPSR